MKDDYSDAGLAALLVSHAGRSRPFRSYCLQVLRPVHLMRFVSYDSFVLLCSNQRDDYESAVNLKGVVYN